MNRRQANPGLRMQPKRLNNGCGTRVGFTLIELLVVIAVVGVLIALVFPVVQSARESARRMQCGNRMRHIGLAATAFHEVHSRLPPGHLGPPLAGDGGGSAPGGFAQNIAATAFLLPFLEQTPLFHQIGVDLSLELWPDGSGLPARVVPFFSDQSTWAVAQTRQPEFLCPSTNAQSTQVDVIAILNPRNCGPACGELQRLVWPRPQEAAALGRTNYLPVAGAFGRLTNSASANRWDVYAGAFWNRSQVRFEEFLDGLSKTLLWGEAVGGWDPSGNRTHAYAWLTAGALPAH